MALRSLQPLTRCGLARSFSASKELSRRGGGFPEWVPAASCIFSGELQPEHTSVSLPSPADMTALPSCLPPSPHSLTIMACSTCLAALDKLICSIDDSETSQTTHHDSFMGLAESSAQGCPFCFALWDQSPEQDREVLLQSDSVTSFKESSRDDGRQGSDEAQQMFRATWCFAVASGSREEGIVQFCLLYDHRRTAGLRLQKTHVEGDFCLVPCDTPWTKGMTSQKSCVCCRADKILQTVSRSLVPSLPGRILPDRRSRGLLRKPGSLHASRITKSATRVKVQAGFQRG